MIFVLLMARRLETFPGMLLLFALFASASSTRMWLYDNPNHMASSTFTVHGTKIRSQFQILFYSAKFIRFSGIGSPVTFAYYPPSQSHMTETTPKERFSLAANRDYEVPPGVITGFRRTHPPTRCGTLCLSDSLTVGLQVKSLRIPCSTQQKILWGSSM